MASRAQVAVTGQLLLLLLLGVAKGQECARDSGSTLPTDAAVTSQFSSLLAWIQRGAEESKLDLQRVPAARYVFELRQTQFGRTLHSKMRFERHDTLAAMSLSNLVTEHTYMRRDPRELSPHVQLAMHLVKICRHEPNSTFAPWCALLPSNHEHLPRYWKPEQWQKGDSHFRDYVSENLAAIRRSYKTVPTMAGISLEDYMWVSDVIRTRGMEGTGGLRHPVLFPLLDMSQHGDVPNIKVAIEVAAGQPSLRAVAVRRILPGDEILNMYEDTRFHGSLWHFLDMWGFASQWMLLGERESHFAEARLSITSKVLQDAIEEALPGQRIRQLGRNFSLKQSTSSADGPRFLEFLRQLVQSGRPDSKEWRWDQEGVALNIGLILVSNALGNESALGVISDYERLFQDTAAMASMRPIDHYQLLVRHSEKATLMWWKERVLLRGIRAARRQDLSLEAYWAPRSIPQVWRGKPPAEESSTEAFTSFAVAVLVQLAGEAKSIQETPVEFCMLLGLSVLCVNDLCCLMQSLLPQSWVVVRLSGFIANRRQLSARKLLQQLCLLLASGTVACMDDAEIFGKREDSRPLLLRLEQAWQNGEGCLSLGTLIVLIARGLADY